MVTAVTPQLLVSWTGSRPHTHTHTHTRARARTDRLQRGDCFDTVWTDFRGMTALTLCGQTAEG